VIIHWYTFIFAESNARVARSETNTVVTVPQIFDDSFSTFFGHVDSVPVATELTGVEADFSFIKSDAPRLVYVRRLLPR
jgi:hypothetical protein